nr:uncharacterized protein LOC100183685 isoform X1 [Ciona intestinalis]|eukprot:XP_002129032.4 uncharacterized protein LOC100183685 isoform X1 [Ciona intestinalis]
MTPINLVFVTLAMLDVFFHTHGDYLVCKPVNEMFENIEINATRTSAGRVSVGRPGKRGPPGRTGPQGIPGVVDWLEIDRRIQMAVTSYLRSNPTSSIITNAISTTSATTRTAVTIATTQTTDECEGVTFERWCVWMPQHGVTRKNQAISVCNNAGGSLVEIINNAMYDVIYDYVNRTYVTSNNFVQTWTGMMYQERRLEGINQAVSLRNVWYPGAPVNSREQWNHILLIVGLLPSRGRMHGLRNGLDSWPGVPLCAKQISPL